MILPVNDKHGNRIKSVLLHTEASNGSETQSEGRQDFFARAPQAYLMTQGSSSCMILRGLEGAEVTPDLSGLNCGPIVACGISYTDCS